jgi:hypothetical protein
MAAVLGDRQGVLLGAGAHRVRAAVPLAAGGRVERGGVVLGVVGFGGPRKTRAPEVFLGGLGGDLAQGLGLVWSER